MPMISNSTKHSHEKSEELLRVILPSHKNWPFLFVSGSWLMLWSIIELPTISTAVYLSSIYFPGVLLASQNVSEFGRDFAAGGYILLLFLIWASLWVASGIYILFDFFYQLVGYELIEVNKKSIFLTRKIFRIHQTKEYPSESIQSLRIVPHIRHFRMLKKTNPLMTNVQLPSITRIKLTFLVLVLMLLMQG